MYGEDVVVDVVVVAGDVAEVRNDSSSSSSGNSKKLTHSHTVTICFLI